MNFESFKLISLIYTKELIGRQDYSKGKQVWIKPSFDLCMVFVYRVSFPFIIVICLYLIILSAVIQLQIMATTLVNLSRKGFDTRAVEGWRAGSWLGPQGLIMWDVSQNTTAGGPAKGTAISATNRKLKNQSLGSEHHGWNLWSRKLLLHLFVPWTCHLNYHTEIRNSARTVLRS